jgi:predicted permease
VLSVVASLVSPFLLVLLTIAVSLIKLGQGFDFDFNTVFTKKNNRHILKGVIVGVFLVPLLFAILILIFKPTTRVMAVLIIMAISPAADMSVQQVKRLGGSEPLAEGMQVISTLLSIITIPLFLRLFDYENYFRIMHGLQNVL